MSFNRILSLPGSFRSTSNYLERQAFLAKDAVFVVDDFAPPEVLMRLHTTIARPTTFFEEWVINRAEADCADLTDQGGRASTLADSRYLHWRGHPSRSVAQSKNFILELSPGDVDIEKLSRAQVARDQGVLATCMAGYIQYLAPRLEN